MPMRCANAPKESYLQVGMRFGHIDESISEITKKYLIIILIGNAGNQNGSHFYSFYLPSPFFIKRR